LSGLPIGNVTFAGRGCKDPIAVTHLELAVTGFERPGICFLRIKPPAGVDPPVLMGDPAGMGSDDRGFPCKERMVKMGD
jgi:hypothetical protein